MNLFEDKNREKYDKLMKVMDKVNHGFASHKLYLAAQPEKEAWKLRQKKLSPCYTTRFKDIIEIK